MHKPKRSVHCDEHLRTMNDQSVCLFVCLFVCGGSSTLQPNSMEDLCTYTELSNKNLKKK